MSGTDDQGGLRMRRTTTMPTWLGRARRYHSKPRAVAHHDGTCDAGHPAATSARVGRCLLAEGHTGSPVHRGRGGARKPTREQAYRAERDEKKRRARLALERARRERATRFV